MNSLWMEFIFFAHGYYYFLNMHKMVEMDRFIFSSNRCTNVQLILLWTTIVSINKWHISHILLLHFDNGVSEQILYHHNPTEKTSSSMCSKAPIPNIIMSLMCTKHSLVGETISKLHTIEGGCPNNLFPSIHVAIMNPECQLSNKPRL